MRKDGGFGIYAGRSPCMSLSSSVFPNSPQSSQNS